MAIPLPAGCSTDTVLFDLDGTLLDSIELILVSARHAFHKLDRPCPTDAEWLTGVGIPLATMFARYARDDADLDALIGAYREHQLAHHDRLVRCYDAVPGTLQTLRASGLRIGVVTSKSESLARRGLECGGIAHFMDTVVGCDATTRHKPDPEPVRLALERLGVPPSNAVFVGDSVHDMAAGNAAGVTTIAALWGPFRRVELEPSRPDHFLDSIAGLPALLHRM
jgi:pyrophosphatase PpaX